MLRFFVDVRDHLVEFIHVRPANEPLKTTCICFLISTGLKQDTLREHRAKRVKQEFHPAPCYQDQALNENTESFQHGQCKGLRLGGSFGKLTRLGSNLLPVWKEYATYADLSGSGPTISGDVRHSYQHHVSEDDWTIRSSKCIRTGLVHKDKLGDAICKSCHEIGNSEKFIWKVCALVLDLDLARLLHTRMYRDEHTEAFIDELKKKEIYTFRCGKSYDSSLQELHKQVKASWSGRPRNTEAMKMFHMLTVKPCVDVEPTASIKASTFNMRSRYTCL